MQSLIPGWSRRFGAAGICVAALCGGLLPAGWARAGTIPLQFQPVALSGTDGQYGPGMGAGVTFASFLLPGGQTLMNSSGQIAFCAQLNLNAGASLPVDSTNHRGVWKWTGGTNQLLLRTGVLSGSVGSSNEPNASFSAYPLVKGFNDRGEISVDSRISIAGVFGTPASVAVIAPDGHQQVRAISATSGVNPNYGPQLGEGSSFSFLPLELDMRLGQDGVVYMAGRGRSSAGAPFRAGLWKLGPAGNQPFALAEETGLLGPGLGDGSRFTDVFSAGTTGAVAFHEINDSGAVLFRGATKRPVAGSADVVGSGLWMHSNGVNAAIALANTDGPMGPNLGPGVRFYDRMSASTVERSFVYFSANNAGEAIFASGLAGHSSRAGLFSRESDGGIHCLALTDTDGPLGPGLGPGVHFYSFLLPKIRANGSMHFLGSFLPSSVYSWGLWQSDGDGVTPIAIPLRDDYLGPGLGEGIQFQKVEKACARELDAGLLFSATLVVGGEIGEHNNYGFWFFDGAQNIPIIRTGDIIDIDPGPGIDFRTIAGGGLGAAFSSNGEDGFGSALTDSGLMAVTLKFTDGSSGIFTVQIPGPATSAVFATFIGLAAGPRRRRSTCRTGSQAR